MGKGSSAANSQGNVKPFTPVEGPAAWYAKDYKNDDSWIYRLTDGDIKEVEAALEVAKASGKEIKVRRISMFLVVEYRHVQQVNICSYHHMTLNLQPEVAFLILLTVSLKQLSAHQSFWHEFQLTT